EGRYGLPARCPLVVEGREVEFLEAFVREVAACKAGGCVCEEAAAAGGVEVVADAAGSPAGAEGFGCVFSRVVASAADDVDVGGGDSNEILVGAALAVGGASWPSQ